MSDDTDFRFAILGEDKASAIFGKVEQAGKRAGQRINEANKGLASYADQAHSRLERVLGPAKALAPELERVTGPLGRLLKASGGLGRAFAPEQTIRSGKALRDTAKAAGELGQAAKAAANVGLVAANENLGAAAASASSAASSLGDAATGATAAGLGFEALGVTAGGVATGLLAVGAAAVGAEVAMAKFISPFATQAQQLQNMADNIGLVTQKLQEFQGAGERKGVSSAATTQALGGIASTLHRAQYGLDAESIAAARLAGVNPGARGSKIDVGGAALKVADAIAAQKDPQAQARLAALFGIGPEALPLFRLGSRGLQAQMQAYASTGDVLSDAQKQQLIQQREAQTNWNQRLHGLGQGAAAGLAPHSTAVLGATAGAGAGGGGEAPASASAPWWSMLGANPALGVGDTSAGLALGQGGSAGGLDLSGAASSIGDWFGRTFGGGRVTARAKSLGDTVAAFFEKNGFNAAQAQGIAAGMFAESGFNAGAVNPKSGAFGVGQWLGNRKAELFRRYGRNPSLQQQLTFMLWELQHGEGRAGGLLHGAASANGALGAYVQSFMRPGAGAETVGDLARGRAYLAAQGVMPDAPALAANDGGPEVIQLASAPARVTGEILIKLDAPAGTKVITKQNGPVALKVARTAAFAGG